MSINFNDGSSEYLSASQSAITVPPFTFAGWLRTDDTLVDQVGLGISDLSSNDEHYHHVAYKATGPGPHVRAHTKALQSKIANSAGVVSQDTWTHMAGVWAATNDRRAWQDGADEGTNTEGQQPTGIDTLSIGAVVQVSNNDYMSGDLAEWAAWDVALDDAEIATLASGYSPLFVRPQSLIWYFPLINDYKCLVSGLILTANGTPTVSEHPRIIYPTTQIIPFIGAAAATTGAGPLYGPLGGPLTGVL